jgi:hypothetical protein
MNTGRKYKKGEAAMEIDALVMVKIDYDEEPGLPEIDWRDLVIAMQNGAVLKGWFDRTGPKTLDCWSLDGKRISQSWRYKAPRGFIRTSPNGYGEPFVGYLTEEAKKYVKC